jgi:16S rRNA (guanine527-N7)-methyltransferase
MNENEKAFTMTPSELRQAQETHRFFEHAETLGIPVTEAQFESIAHFYECLMAKNAVMNLTRITAWGDFLQRHILESLLYSLFIPEGAKVLDVGSGGGFPLIPLAIYRRDLYLTAIESSKKKAVYLEETLQTLALEGSKHVKVLADRAETLGHVPHLRHNFDVVTSRAVASLPVLAELCLPFVKREGVLLALKGPKWEEEMYAAENALETLGGEFEDVYIPEGEGLSEAMLGHNFLVRILKCEPTPKAYPRLPGIPAKQPL